MISRHLRLLPLAVVLAVPFAQTSLAQAPPAPSASASTAPAPPSPEERAAELKKQGDVAMDSLRYDDALAAYQQAYGISQSPALLYNMGQVYRARGQYPEALDALTRFDQQAPPELKAQVPKLAELLAEVRAHVATLTFHVNVAGARILVRASQVGVTPVSGPLRLNAGPAKIEIIADEYFPFTEQVDLRGGAETVIDASLVAKATSGILAVEASVGGTVVMVDGKRAGEAPLETIVGAGSHEVVARHDGFDDTETQAVVKAGERREITITLQKKPPITAKWWFWTGIGVVVAGGAVLTYALLTEKRPSTGDNFQPGQVAGPLVHW
jgi:hypothetical protein